MQRTIALATARPLSCDPRPLRTFALPLCAAGWRVALIAPDRPAEAPEGLQAYRCGGTGWIGQERLLRTLRHTKPRLLLLADERFFPLLPLLRDLGVRTVCDVALEEGTDARAPRPLWADLLRARAWRRLPAADALIARDEAAERRLSQRGADPVSVRGLPTAEELEALERALFRIAPVPRAVCAIGQIGGASERLGRICAAAGASLLTAPAPAGSAGFGETAALCARAQAALLLDGGADRRERLWLCLCAGLPVVAGEWAAGERGTGGLLCIADETDEAACAEALRRTLADSVGRAQARFGRAPVQRRLSFAPHRDRLLRLCEALWEDAI